MRTSTIAASLLFSLAGLTGPITAQDWGDLSVKLVYDGTPPQAIDATITTDKEFCCQFKVVKEDLVVNKDNAGIANAVVFMYVSRRGPKPPVHSSYAELAKKEVKLDNNQCRFAPHVAKLRTGQPLVLGNSDDIGHNVNIGMLRNSQYNKVIPSGGTDRITFAAEEPVPVKVVCNIHPWMGGYVVLKEHPYVGISDENGQIEIKNVPVGDWTFIFWQEKAGYLEDLEISGVETKPNGRYTVSVNPGQNELGSVKVPPSLFEE